MATKRELKIWAEITYTWEHAKENNYITGEEVYFSVDVRSPHGNRCAALYKRALLGSRRAARQLVRALGWDVPEVERIRFIKSLDKPTIRGTYGRVFDGPTWACGFRECYAY